jgi:hypothetical protein
MAARICAGLFPARAPLITSRVMSMHSVHVAAWLVHVVRSAVSALM